MLAVNSSAYLALDSNHLQACKRFCTTNYCEDIFLVSHTSEHTCESAIYWNDEPANVINKKCKFEYIMN